MNDNSNGQPEALGDGPLTDEQLEGMSMWDHDDKIFESPTIVRYLVLRAVAELRQLRTALSRGSQLRLVWYQRHDSLWSAACACNAMVCGVEFARRAEAEAWHFDLTNMERAHRTAHPERFAGNQIPACGPKLPEPNPNLPNPFVFP